MPSFALTRRMWPGDGPSPFKRWRRPELYFPNGTGIISGVTRDSSGNVLTSCTVKLFNQNDVLVAQQVSDASTGAFSFTVPGNGLYYEVAMKQGSPDVAGATIDVSATASGGSVATFDPTTLAWTGYWRAPYSGSPLLPTASAGSSGSNGSLAGSTSPGPNSPPSVGPTYNSLADMQFAASSSQFMQAANGPSTYITTTSIFVAALFKVTTLVAHAASYWDNPAIVTDDAANWGLTVADDGLWWGTDDSGTGTHEQKINLGVPTLGSVYAVFAQISGGVQSAQLNRSLSGTTFSVAALTLGTHLFCGGNWNLLKFLTGEVLELGLSTSLTISGVASNMLSYYNARYGLSL